MPCNCDHMNPNSKEINTSILLCFLGELKGKPYEKRWLEGYHPNVYNTRHDYDPNELAQELCSSLKGQDVQGYTLELQMWWRDHQEADRLREEAERAEAEREHARDVAELKRLQRKLGA